MVGRNYVTEAYQAILLRKNCKKYYLTDIHKLKHMLLIATTKQTKAYKIKLKIVINKYIIKTF